MGRPSDSIVAVLMSCNMRLAFKPLLSLRKNKSGRVCPQPAMSKARGGGNQEKNSHASPVPSIPDINSVGKYLELQKKKITRTKTTLV